MPLLFLTLRPDVRINKGRVGVAGSYFHRVSLPGLTRDVHALDGKPFDLSSQDDINRLGKVVKELSNTPFVHANGGIYPFIAGEPSHASPTPSLPAAAPFDLLSAGPPTTLDEAIRTLAEVFTQSEQQSFIQGVANRLEALQTAQRQADAATAAAAQQAATSETTTRETGTTESPQEPTNVEIPANSTVTITESALETGTETPPSTTGDLSTADNITLPEGTTDAAPKDDEASGALPTVPTVPKDEPVPATPKAPAVKQAKPAPKPARKK